MFNDPDEFASEMPATEYEEDEEYYDEDEEEGEDYEDEEEAPAGRVNVVRNAMFAVAAVIALAAGAYVLAVNFMPDTVNSLVNNLPFVSHTDQTQTAEAPAAGGEVAPPPGGDQATMPQAPHHHVHHPMAGNASGAVAPAVANGARAGEASSAELPQGAAPKPHAMPPKPMPKPVAKPKPLAPKPAVKPVAKPHWVAKHPVARRWPVRSRYAARPYARRYAYYGHRYARPVYHRPAYHRPVYRRPVAAAPHYGHYAVQVGSFSNGANAAALAGRLRAKGIPAYVSGAGTSYAGAGYMVRSVAVHSRASANNLLAQYRRAGYSARLISVGGGAMAVEAGVYSSHAAAQAAISRLNARGLFGLIHQTSGGTPVSHGLARVWIGGYSTRAGALTELRRLQALGVPAAVVSY
ncbi:MAG TPA: SPOR domain-containing protein [Oscillatoriaceae cyanobacterium]